MYILSAIVSKHFYESNVVTYLYNKLQFCLNQFFFSFFILSEWYRIQTDTNTEKQVYMNNLNFYLKFIYYMLYP